MNTEKCQICGCTIHRKGEYAKPTVKGRSHATKHHYVAERFYGRTKNKRKYKKVKRIFNKNDFPDYQRKTGTFCYECHEELLHNPILLPADIEKLSLLVHRRKCNEDKKRVSREKIAERIKLFHERELHSTFYQLCRSVFGHARPIDLNSDITLFRQEYETIWRYRRKDNPPFSKRYETEGKAGTFDFVILNKGFVKTNKC
jgi:hypothetical protein